MRDTNDPNKQDLDELFRQIDDLLEDSGEVIQPEYDGIDLAEFTPQGTQIEEPVVYQNYSNNYGSQVRNYSNNYGQTPSAAQPRPKPQPKPQTVIPAYNADFRKEQMKELDQRRQTEYRDYGQTEAQANSRKAPKKPKKRRRGCGCGCLPVLLAVVLVAVGLFIALVQPPQADTSIGQRKDDTATILLCGTDLDGTRTDTMMLVYLSGSESRVGLLSLPRDSMVKTSGGNRVKLNAAYGLNNCGEEGMDALMDYVARIIGYRPDGYILVDMALVPDLVDLMGGVDVNVQQDIEVEGVTVSAGQQHLDGTHVLALLRYRKGYYNADLGRIEVQRTVIQACMEQWLTPGKLPQLLDALNAVMDRSTSDLSTGNFLWLGMTALKGMDNICNDTLPGVPKMVSGASFYVLDRDAVAQLVNESYNPYDVTIDPDDLTIVGG